MLDKINRRALRPQSIHMYIEASAGTQHPQHFLNSQLGGLDVMEDAVGIDVIEAPVRKGELASASTFHDSRSTESSTRQLKVPLGDVHAGGNRTVPCKLQKVTTRAAADFEHALPGVMPKFGGLTEPRVVAISLLFGEVERSV